MGPLSHVITVPKYLQIQCPQIIYNDGERFCFVFTTLPLIFVLTCADVYCVQQGYKMCTCVVFCMYCSSHCVLLFLCRR